MKRYRNSIILISILCFSLILLFLSNRILQGFGVLLFGLALSYPVYSSLRYAPDGWKAQNTDTPFSLFGPQTPAICISEELIKGRLAPDGDLLLPGGTYPVSRIRSLPGGVLLCASIAATYEHTKAAEEILALFPEINIDPEQFRRRFPPLRILHLASVTGQVVQDGLGERVFFSVDSRDSNRIRFMQHCRLIQSEGTARELDEAEKRQLLDPPVRAILLFTGVPHGSQVDSLTFLGSLALKHFQHLDDMVLADIRYLENRGHEVFLAHPLQAAQDTAVPACPVAVHEPGAHTLIMEKTSPDAPSLREAVEQMLVFGATLKRLFWFHTAFILAIVLLMILSPLPSLLAVPLLGLPLVFPWMFRHQVLHTLPACPSRSSVFFAYLIFLLDSVLIFLLIVLTGSPEWLKSVLFHMLMLSFLYSCFLPYACLRQNFTSLRFFLLFLGSLLVLSLTAWMVVGLEGIFSVLLAGLAGLLLLVSGLVRTSAHSTK